MTVARSVAEVLTDRVRLEIESIDRMYLNVYVPGLQYTSGVASFFQAHRGHPFASSALMDPISKDLIAGLHRMCRDLGVPMIDFEKGQRKDDVALQFLAEFTGEAGPIGNYAHHRRLTGRAGLFPARYQSDTVDLAGGQLVRCANRSLRAALLLIAANLAKCNAYYRALVEVWTTQGKDPRHSKVKIASRFCRSKSKRPWTTSSCSWSCITAAFRRG